MVKKLLTLILALSMCLNLCITASAVKYGDVASVPKAFWPIFTPYEKALNDNDTAKIASTGDNVISYWLKGGTAEERAAEWVADITNHAFEINMVWAVSNKVAECYKQLGDIKNAIRVYKIAFAFVDAYKSLVPYIGGNPDDMEFARTQLQNIINAYDVTVDVYAELRDGTGDTSFNDAINEPRNGVWFGEPPVPDAVMDANKKPSSTVIYVVFENEDMRARVEYDLGRNYTLYGYTPNDYSVIQIAWNFVNEGDSLRSVPGSTAKVTQAARYLKSLNIPVLLRVGAEMNVWQKTADAEEYKTAFRFIADIMHQEAPNVALVWSVNNISAKGLTYDMYYPGDTYVDWVGISLYTSKYFNGNPDTSDVDAAIYSTGKYANPVKFMRELVAQYGARKPIMISEGGVSLYSTVNSEDLTEWALPRIRQTYAYIPMLFPEVKAMYWFNANTNRERIRWDFKMSPAAKALYGQLTSSDRFLGKGETQSPVTYKKLGTATFPADAVVLCTYAPYFTIDNIVVQYDVDGTRIGQSADIPYRSSLNLSAWTDGAHKLTVTVLSGTTVLTTKEYNLRKNGSTVTISTGEIAAPPKLTATPTSSAVIVNGERIAFDAYLIGGNNYFKLRDLAFVLSGTEKQFELSWDGAANAIYISTGVPYTAVGGEMSGKGSGAKTPQPTNSRIFLNCVETAFTAYGIEGNNYFKLRDIGRALDFSVEWDGANNAIIIDTTKGNTE
jgi:hypothetical protein